MLGERRASQAQLTLVLVTVSAASAVAMSLYPVIAEALGHALVVEPYIDTAVVAGGLLLRSQASGATGNGSVAHRARWLVRVMTSLMLFPGHDEDDERTMLEEFVVPIVLPKRPADQATQ